MQVFEKAHDGPSDAQSSDILFLDIEGVCTLGYYKADQGQTRYSREARNCLSALCRNGARLVIISREFLDEGPNMFYRLQQCGIRDEWLHKDWLASDPEMGMMRSISKERATHAWLNNHAGQVRKAAAVDDNPAEFKALSIRLFSPDPDTGLTEEMAAQIAEHFGCAQAFHNTYQSPRVRQMMGHKIGPVVT